MSLADNKRSVFTTVGAYTSLMETGKMPKQSDLFPSINNTNDIIPYLLDVLKTVAGTEAIKEAIGGMFTKVLVDIEPKLKTTLKKQFIQSNAGDAMPSNGITVPVKQIDINGKFKVAPDSELGNLIYGEEPSSFNGTAHSAIVNAGTPIGFGNISIKYIESSDSFEIKPSGTTTTIGDFFSGYIDNTELINKKEILSSVMDNVYGTLTNKQEKTIEQLVAELENEMLLQQVLDDDDSFIILPNKYDELLNKATEMAAGTLYYDMGCGLLPSVLDFNDLTKLVSNISGSTDPFYVGNQIEATIDESNSGTTATQNMSNKNKQTIKDGFFEKIIKVLTLKLLEAVTTAPQIRALLGIMSSLQNNGVVLLDKPSTDLKHFKIMIKCMAKEIMAIVAAFIFGLAVGYLIKLLKPVYEKVIKEKLKQYSEIIKSLTGKLGKLVSNGLGLN